MITEDYVSFEVAKLLKEKGFSYRSYGDYNSQGEFQEGYGEWNKTSIYYAAPTLQMAMKWLRENHNLFIQVEFDPPKFSSDIYKMDEIDEYGSAKHIPPTFANAKNYEDAVEAAIKYCLENLI